MFTITLLMYYEFVLNRLISEKNPRNETIAQLNASQVTRAHNLYVQITTMNTL
jgi:hypothetical protein